MSEERILVAHGDNSMAKRIEYVLTRTGLNVVGKVSDRNDVLLKVADAKPTVVIINTLWDWEKWPSYRSAIREGVKLISKLHQQFADIRIIVYTRTMYRDELFPILSFCTYLDADEVFLETLVTVIKESVDEI